MTDPYALPLNYPIKLVKFETNVLTPIYAEMITTTIPNKSNHIGCLYVFPMIFLLLEAIRQIPNVIGRIKPLNAPAKTRSVAGFPRISIINVESIT